MCFRLSCRDIYLLLCVSGVFAEVFTCCYVFKAYVLRYLSAVCFRLSCRDMFLLRCVSEFCVKKFATGFSVRE